jgi:hypothetical protein
MLTHEQKITRLKFFFEVIRQIIVIEKQNILQNLNNISHIGNYLYVLFLKIQNCFIKKNEQLF